MATLSAGQAGLLAAVIATTINVVIARGFTYWLKTPGTFAPFTLLPIMSGSSVGALGGTMVYWLLSRFLGQPYPAIYGLTIALWLASVYLPLRLLKKRPRRTNRFDGATPQVVGALFVLHTVVALTSLACLRFWLV